MNLSEAKLCMNARCEEIIYHASPDCPKCAGTYFYPLANWVLPQSVTPSREHLEKQVFSLVEQIADGLEREWVM